MYTQPAAQRGFTLIEVVIVSAITALVFGALFSSFQYSLKLVNQSRAKLSALSVANDRMEYFRSLPYDDVGTIGGIPNGTIPQNGTTTLNGIEFAERVLVEYVDDPADGQDTATTTDTNLIPADYKRVKVEYTWTIHGATSSIAMVSNIVPRSVETTLGGGTVRVNVLDADSTFLPGASVRLINTTTAPPIDTTRFTDGGGVALFSGAPAASGYEVVVTANIGGNQFSTDQTHQPSPSNPNPTLAPFAVLESDVSTLTFQIGKLSDINMAVLSTLVEGSFEAPFSDGSDIASSSDTNVAGGMLQLADTGGVYESSGTAYLDSFEPTPLRAWATVRAAVDTPVNTSHRIQFFTGTSTYTLVPDADLPGNAVGFTDSLINISDLDTSVYPALTVGVTLLTSDTSVTPTVDEIGIYYRESQLPLGTTDMQLRGNKVIGTALDASPIYKYQATSTTDAGGTVSLLHMEFDEYTITPPGAYDIALACPAHPIVHQATVDSAVEVLFVPNAASTLRVSVENSLGQVIPGVDVQLQRAGYDVTQSTESCGQTFFTGGVSDGDYTLTVSAPGYITYVESPLTITGDTTAAVTLLE